MTRSVRPLLSVLLCLLVVSWGTCPCVLARALGLDGAPSVAKGATHVEAAAAETPCRCCGRTPHTPGEPAEGEAPSGPDPLACCGCGSLHSVLEPGGSDELPAPVLCASPDAPALDVLVPAASRTRTPDAASTGPPGRQAPHACPVGIVLLLA